MPVRVLVGQAAIPVPRGVDTGNEFASGKILERRGDFGVGWIDRPMRVGAWARNDVAANRVGPN